MAKFFTNTENAPCVIKETVSLTDCLACSGCITDQEASALAPDTTFLSASGVATVFLVAPEAKHSLHTAFPDLGFRAFEAALVAHLRNAMGGVLVVDTSYFAKEQEACISSECPAVVLYVERVFPSLVPLLSRHKTHQQIAAEYAHEWLRNHPTPGPPRVVSIVQCYDKKDEGRRDSTRIDHFLGARDLYAHIKDGFVPDTAYVPETWELSRPGREPVISGLEECMRTFRRLRAGEPVEGTMELRICRGGCSHGPALLDAHTEVSDGTDRTSGRIRFATTLRAFQAQKARTFAVEW